SSCESPHGDDAPIAVADCRLWPGVGRDEIRPPGRRHSDEGGDDVLDSSPRCGEVLDLPVPGTHDRRPGEGADRLRRRRHTGDDTGGRDTKLAPILAPHNNLMRRQVYEGSPRYMDLALVKHAQAALVGGEVAV